MAPEFVFLLVNSFLNWRSAYLIVFWTFLLSSLGMSKSMHLTGKLFLNFSYSLWQRVVSLSTWVLKPETYESLVTPAFYPYNLSVSMVFPHHLFIITQMPLLLSTLTTMSSVKILIISCVAYYNSFLTIIAALIIHHLIPFFFLELTFSVWRSRSVFKKSFMTPVDKGP